MVATVATVAYLGLEARSVEVQVQLASGVPAFAIVGLADKAVGESKERVRAALAAIGLAMPPRRITVNLSPADLPKEGSHYDLPIAVGLLAAMGVVDAETVSEWLVVGELALDGRIAPAPGVLLAALHAAEVGLGLICPAAQGSEASWGGQAAVLAAPDLLTLIGVLKGEREVPAPEPAGVEEVVPGPDLAQVKGQDGARRALEIAAAGGHNLLMVGPPGSGKSLMAACLPGILPPLSASEALEVSTVASVAGTLRDGKLVRARPFRSPHHSASMAALTGGGLRVRPGEVSLAHRGVLFLDELPEFSRPVLDSLRQPLETGRVDVARANAHVTFPANVQLIAAMNPCRCGHLGDPMLACARAPKCAADYQAKVSGPLLDRIDLHIEVEAVPASDLLDPRPSEASAVVAERVAAARSRSQARYGEGGPRTNADADGDVLAQAAALDEPGRELMATAAATLRLTARGYTRVLRVARTIADLAGVEEVKRMHLAEALSYRRRAPVS